MPTARICIAMQATESRLLAQLWRKRQIEAKHKQKGQGGAKT
jgi:hypothetical protein